MEAIKQSNPFLIESCESKEQAAKKAAEAINAELMKNEPLLLMLSGGSALDVLTHINTDLLNENVTITLVDERFTTSQDHSNFYAFSQTSFYKAAQKAKAHIMSTEVLENESRATYTERLTAALNAHEHTRTMALFGVGEGTHTAGIFPFPKEEFGRIYGDRMVADLDQDKKAPRERVSITPTFIKERINMSIVYAVGEGKADLLRNMINRGPIEDAPARALQGMSATIFTDQKL